jgi:basic membrane lipoprotein Med (substrate-binding protein (PBP1-ABC) superfamily)
MEYDEAVKQIVDCEVKVMVAVDGTEVLVVANVEDFKDKMAVIAVLSDMISDLSGSIVQEMSGSRH